ncbi:MAG: hypothetical protein ABIS84_04635 [Arachnia sp.]
MASGLPVDPETGRVASGPLHCTGHTCGTIENTATIAVDTLRELLDGKQIRVTPVLDLNTIPAEHQNRPSLMLILVRLDVTFLWFALLAVWVVALLRTLVRRRMNTSHPVLHEGGHRPSPSAV